MGLKFSGAGYAKTASLDLSPYSAIALGFKARIDSSAVSGFALNLDDNYVPHSGSFYVYFTGSGTVEVFVNAAGTNATRHFNWPAFGVEVDCLLALNIIAGVETFGGLWLRGQVASWNDAGHTPGATSAFTKADFAVGARADGIALQLNGGAIGKVGIWGGSAANLVNTQNAATLAAGDFMTPLSVQPKRLKHYWPLFGVNNPEPDARGPLTALTTSGVKKFTLRKEDGRRDLQPRHRGPAIWGALSTGPILKTSSDGFSLTESWALAAVLQSLDSATLSEAAALAVSLTQSDGYSLTEAIVLAATITGSDAATIGESILLAATLTGADSATLAELGQIVTGIPTQYASTAARQAGQPDPRWARVKKL